MGQNETVERLSEKASTSDLIWRESKKKKKNGTLNQFVCDTPVRHWTSLFSRQKVLSLILDLI